MLIYGLYELELSLSVMDWEGSGYGVARDGAAKFNNLF
jgi:hypothetical protein